jgi:hypothetical protein
MCFYQQISSHIIEVAPLNVWFVIEKYKKGC